MDGLLETVAPGRLGASFRWLLASSWASNLGDGIAMAAGPLLIASQTREPLLVAMAVLLQQLPWLLFGLQAGALADRLDRRKVVVTVDLARTAVLVVLCVAIATGAVSVVVVLLALFVLGTAEVFADNASSTLLPMLVGRSDLTVGNARLQTGSLTLNHLAGPPIGAASYGWITRRISLGDVMRIGLVIETLTHLALALATRPALALPVFFVFGAHAFIWGTTSVTVRQRAVPSELQGRVGSVNSLGHYGGMVAGAALGGVLAQQLGITAPFWFAFVGSAVFLLVIWRQLRHITHDDGAHDDGAVAAVPSRRDA